MHNVVIRREIIDRVMARRNKFPLWDALDPEKTVAGPVFPVLGRPDSSLTPDESLLRWTEFLGTVPAGHVVACQPQDDARALMGELSAETLQFRGVRGYIVDGGCRDVSFIKALGFPVFWLLHHPS